MTNLKFNYLKNPSVTDKNVLFSLLTAYLHKLITRLWHGVKSTSTIVVSCPARHATGLVGTSGFQSLTIPSSLPEASWWC